MSGQRGISEFCSPETLNVSRGEAEGNIEVKLRGNKTLCVPMGPVTFMPGEKSIFF